MIVVAQAGGWCAVLIEVVSGQEVTAWVLWRGTIDSLRNGMRSGM
jgi:hypothetical protein